MSFLLRKIKLLYRNSWIQILNLSNLWGVEKKKMRHKLFGMHWKKIQSVSSLLSVFLVPCPINGSHLQHHIICLLAMIRFSKYRRIPWKREHEFMNNLLNLGDLLIQTPTLLLINCHDLDFFYHFSNQNTFKIFLI